MRFTAIALAVLAGATAADAQFSARTAPVGNPGGNQNLVPCGQYDDGSTENALGLIAGGEMAWLHHFTSCPGTIGRIDTAYGSAMFPGGVTNGNNSKIFVHTDTDANPNNGTTWLATVLTVVTNGDTDILNPNPIGPSVVNGSAWVGASADQVAGEFPGPMDQNSSGPQAWVVGSTAGPGTLNERILSSNNVPPVQMTAIGFPAYWLLRADDGSGPIGTPECFGDGTGTNCPCGNNDGPAAGCSNSTGSGCGLTAQSTLGGTLDATNAIPGQPGLFFQGDVSIGGGNGIVFGDGLRCCGTNVVRLGVRVPNAQGFASIDDVQNRGGAQAGQTKCYQYWYRDPNNSPCGLGFNLSNAVSITW